MYIIGIDIGKNHHEASIVSPEGKQIGHSLRFATTHKGADSLMSFIFNNIGNSSCIFGMEATGHYWYPIYSFLKARGYTIYVINPIQSDSLRKMYIRQTKNDSIDSFLIAEVIRFGQFTTTSMADEKTAKYPGKRGNDICIKIAENVDESDCWDVETYLDAEVVDAQTVTRIEDLRENAFVEFGGTGGLTAAAGIYLTGGTTAAATGSAYTAFLEAAEKEDFNALAYNGADEKTKKLFVNFTKRMREEEGVKFVTVLHDYPAADHEGVISVGTAAELVYWTAGASAGAEVNESLTNAAYDGEYEVDARLKKSDYIKGIRKGQLLFYEEDGTLRVLRDINSFTSFAAAKNSDFSSNRVVRVLDSIANDVANIFSKYYLGKQSNNANGRNLLKAEILAYHEELMKLEAIEGFTADDITVEKGTEKQDVVVYEAIQPVDAMEKLYMKVEVA